MKSFQLTWLIVWTVIVLGMGTRPSAAVVLYPWCVQYGSIASGTLNCEFTSFKQCLATGFRQWFELHPKSAVSELSAITALRTSHSSVTAGTAANKKRPRLEGPRIYPAFAHKHPRPRLYQ